jgi:TonB-dependent SusC/RagA subfamily outer membrane receptor
MKKLVNLFSLLLLMTGLIGFAQNSVSGVVSDTDGLPLPGATVVVQGTAIGVTTDFDGNYSISASEGDVLVFSYVGYVSQSIEVGASATINVSLESSTALDEVVVTGIGAVERQRSVSSVVTIGEEQIEGLAFTNPSNALQGRVAGLRVATISGAPGSPTSIRIRGEGSLTGNNAPLFVIDGVPIVNGSVAAGASGNPGLGILSMINGDDIESITVLKDASSTAAYGNRGSNGVIVITTKKGSAGKVQYQLSSQYGFQNYAVEGRQMLTGAQYAELATEMMMNRVPSWDSDTAYAWVRRNLSGYQAWEDGGQVDGGWADLVRVKDAPIQKYNLSAAGGDATQNFRISLGYTQQDGTSIGSDYEQVSGAFSYTRKAGKVTLTTNNRVSNALLNGQLEGSAYFGNPQATRFFMRENFNSRNPDGSWLVPHPAIAHHTPYLTTKTNPKTQRHRHKKSLP